MPRAKVPKLKDRNQIKWILSGISTNLEANILPVKQHLTTTELVHLMEANDLIKGVLKVWKEKK